MHRSWWALVAIVIAGCGDNVKGNNPNGACDDGLFCNGIERVIDGTCLSAPMKPCDDASDCTTDVCHEATQTCEHLPMGASCAVCRQENCTPNCAGRASWIERWRADVHANPDAALDLFHDTGAQWMVPIHFGTFFEPADRERPLVEAAVARHHLEHSVRVLAIGETTTFRY